AARPGAAGRRRRLPRLARRALPALRLGRSRPDERRPARSAARHARLGPRLRRREPAARRDPRRRPAHALRRRERDPARPGRVAAGARRGRRFVTRLNRRSTKPPAAITGTGRAAALPHETLGMDAEALKRSFLSHLEFTLAELPRHVDTEWEPY